MTDDKCQTTATVAKLRYPKDVDHMIDIYNKNVVKERLGNDWIDEFKNDIQVVENRRVIIL